MSDSDFKVLFTAVREGNVEKVKKVFKSIQVEGKVYLPDSDLNLFCVAAQNVDNSNHSF